MSDSDSTMYIEHNSDECHSGTGGHFHKMTPFDPQSWAKWAKFLTLQIGVKICSYNIFDMLMLFVCTIMYENGQNWAFLAI
jgi:hypothetical protein